MTAAPPPVLDVRDLEIRFDADARIPNAVNGISFAINSGEVVALVGESGCGKSTVAMAIMRLLPRFAQASGTIVLDGQPILALLERQMRGLRGSTVSVIFQEPMTSLNPVRTIGDQIVEAIQQHQPLGDAQARERAIELLDMVRLPEARRRADDYPHQFSGGQRQRVMIAMAISCGPKLLIADEPTTALDATIQAEIFELLMDLRRQLGMAILFISHDLAMVSRWADRVVVMHHGEKMEELAAPDLFAAAVHPYTKGLIRATVSRDAAAHYRTTHLPEILVERNRHDAYRFSVISHPPVTDTHYGDQGAEVLKIDNLVVQYAPGTDRAVDGVSLSIRRGETLGLVGESGSGKSSLSKAILRLLPVQSGSIRFLDKEITGAGTGEMRHMRREMQMIFQDPAGSLNPRQRVEDIIGGPLRVHERLTAPQREARIDEMLDLVGLARTSRSRLPHEFSGGQRQRIAIARALILRPALVICDEPVSALDVSVQAQILNLLCTLKAELNLSYLFISHDLAVVRYMSDNVAVMKSGRIVEWNDHGRLWDHPEDDYTRKLISASTGLSAH